MQNVVAAISLKRIAENARAVKKRAGVPLIAVVKDDAYGHGAEAVCHALSREAIMFAVATVDEGAALRAAGIGRDILVLTPALHREDALRLSAYGLIASVSSLSALRVLEGTGVSVRAHLAVNTGMNRYGVRPEQVLRCCRSETVSIEGVYSHLYAPSSKEDAQRQAELFRAAAERVRAVFPHALTHLSATGGMLAGVPSEAVRAGLSLYGYLPEGFSGLAVRPAMKLYAFVSQSGTHFGGGIGYRKAERRYGRLHTLRLGYGDGFFQSGGLGAVGKLCMDACVRQGGGVFGGRRLVMRDVGAYAASHGTTPYEVLVSVGKNARRFYDIR